jgi:hypothetical protein
MVVDGSAKVVPENIISYIIYIIQLFMVYVERESDGFYVRRHCLGGSVLPLRLRPCRLVEYSVYDQETCALVFRQVQRQRSGI